MPLLGEAQSHRVDPVVPGGSTATIAHHPASDGAPSDTIGFVVGNIEYLLVHELAHFVIAEKNVPILGPVENAADYIATLALIREAPLDPSQQDRAEQFLLATAGAFEASWQTGTQQGSEVPYWGEHALSIQRYYNIACLLYGSNPTAFASVPERAGMPATRAQSCIAEYARAAAAFDWLVGAYGRRPGDPAGVAIDIRYEPPPTAVSASVVHALKSIELLERITMRLHERFLLNQSFTLVMRRCGRAEAAWIPERRELAICYELIDTLYVLGLSEVSPDRSRRAARGR
jgi:hypothetical protein